jgi:hypothetical protein
MPHHVACKNIELFGREVLPHLQKIWEDKAFENAWWPKKLRNRAVKQREIARWRTPPFPYVSALASERHKS